MNEVEFIQNERELISYAAKAINQDIGCKNGAWNPIWNTDEALILAIKCGMTIHTTNRYAIAPERLPTNPEIDIHALRKSIVMCASNIGRQIPHET